jgi:hypothetical protein
MMHALKLATKKGTQPMKYFILGMFLFFVGQPGHAQPIPVAILELEVAGIEPTAKTGLTNRLRAELLGTGQFDVMERQQMEVILAEQGFQQTGACSDDVCLAEAGKILGVAKMIAGSVAKVGSLFEIGIRMIDVGSGRILLEVTDATPGPLENVLTKSLRTVALKFAAQAAAPRQELHGFGNLALRSNPAGAKIFLDDQFLSQTTPTVLDSLPTGVHVVRLQKELLAASKAIFITPDETAQIDLELSPLKGNLKIITEPGGAEIFLDHQFKGQSPAQLFDLPVGSYYLKLVKPGFVEHTQIVALRENESRLVSAKLTPMACISIITNPTGCKILADDSLAGFSPVLALAVPPGFHRFKASKDGFVEIEQIHSILAGQSDTLNLQLPPAATLVVRTDPNEAEVWVNTLFKGRTPVTVRNLPPGPALLKLRHLRCLDYLTEISLLAGQTQTMAFNLTPRTSSLLVESIPADAGVEVDGQPQGKTPLEVKNLAFGEHLVRVKKSGYSTYEQRVVIQNEAPQSIKVKFEIAKGTLFLFPRPNDALVEINGERLRNISTTGLLLFPGDYTLHARRPGYENFTRQLSIGPGEGLSLNVDLPPKTAKKALLRSLLFPGLGQRYAEKQTRFRLFSWLEATSLLGAVVSDLVFDVKIKDYHDRRRDYLQALSEENLNATRQQMDDAYLRAESAETWRDAFVFAGAGIWLLNLLDAALLPPLRPQRGEMGLFLSQAPHLWQIGMAARF